MPQRYGSCAATLVRFRHQTEPVAAHSAPPALNQFPSILISISFPNVAVLRRRKPYGATAGSHLISFFLNRAFLFQQTKSFNIDVQDRQDKISMPSGFHDFLIPELSCSSCISMFIFFCERPASLSARNAT